jgi:hypothetical protein
MAAFDYRQAQEIRDIFNCTMCVMRLIIGALIIPGLLAAQPPPDVHDVRVNLKQLRQARSCYTDAETYSQEFVYEAVYTNRGSTKLRVRFGTEVPVGVFVAKTLDDFGQKRLEDEQHWDVFPGADGRLMGSRAGDERIVDFRPGASAISKGATNILVRRVPRKLPGTIDPGSHILQLQIILQISNAGPNSRALKRQGDKDFQWVSVLSDPAQIEVSANPATLEDCTDQK